MKKAVLDQIEVVDTTDPNADSVVRKPGSFIQDTAGIIWIQAVTAWVQVSSEATSNVLTILEETTTSRTVSSTDQNNVIEVNNASAATVTIPADASDALAVGFTADYVQTGAGLMSIIGETGVEVNGNTEAGASESNVDGQGQWKAVTIYKEAADVWRVIGGA